MQRNPHTRWLLFVTLAALLVAMQAPRSYGQEPPLDDALGQVGGRAAEALLPAAAATDQAIIAASGGPIVRLPLIISPLQLIAQTAGSINEATAEPINSTDTFSFGTKRIYLTVQLDGASGQTYRIEAMFPNGKLLKGGNKTVSTPLYRDAIYVCRTTSSCGSGEVELDRGTYLFRVYIGNLLYAERRAIVR